MMKRTALYFLIALAPMANAQIPTTDAVAFGQRAAQQLETIAQMGSQLVELKNQLEQAKRQYDSITGIRNLGSILYDQTLRNTLPDDMSDIYSSSMNSAFGISGSIADILETEKNQGTVSDIKSKISERQRNLAATDKAIGLRAYDGAKKRLDQIESLMGRINGTSDPKAIAELQARIAVEQAAVGNEQSKLAVISQLQANEAKLIEQQKSELSQKVLSNDNTGMPGIR